MSKASSPMEGLFAMQRRSVEQGRQLFHQSMDSQRRFAELVVEGMEASESMQRKGTDTMRTGMESMLRSMESTMPGGDGMFEPMFEAMDEQFAASDRTITEFWASYENSMADGLEAYEAFLDDYTASVDDSVDRTLEMFDDVEQTQPEK